MKEQVALWSPGEQVIGHLLGDVWTPERHLHAFGGLFPSSSVISAALAASTQRIRIRAGSVVLPLHSPIRVAEEWSVVDNLSTGRVKNLTTGAELESLPLPPLIREILTEGGLIPHLKRRLAGAMVQVD